ncbi:MAG: molecular chaperone DnaJ [Hydrogenophilales bacterium 28-61-23]|nr:MAG: molecular chaperone DnaJ [Hydrogenophilales bacterium 28-61-23]
MTRTHLKTVSIATSQDPSTLSKQQKAFNSLIKQIEKSRAQLVAWEAASQAYLEKYSREWVPLVETSQALQIKFVHRLDQASCQPGLTKTERGMIADLIVELAGDLVAARNDAEMKAVYNKHSGTDFDSEEAARIKAMKAMLEASLGVELGDVDMNSPEDVMQHAKAQIDARQAREDAEQEAREEHKAKRKKSAKQLAKEARQQAEAQQISQSIREVYRKLVSALHPDREPDPRERDRKTALMKRVNLAYDKKDLLQLLELQLELEHIDQASIGQIGEERLKHYNTILKEQHIELIQEIMHVEGEFRARFGIDPLLRVSPGNIMGHLKNDIRDVQYVIQDIGKNLRVFDDVKKFKAWLKEMRRRPARDDYFDDPDYF